MSLALGHFAVGSALTVLAVAYLVPYPRLVALLVGVWAMIPDAHWVTPVFTDELRAFQDAPAANVCWFHRALDAADPTDSPAVAAAALAGLVVDTALAERRQYRALARVRALTEAK